MFNNEVIAGSSGQGGGFYDFPLEQSLRFEDGDSAYLSRTPASASNRKTMTFSFWFKRGNFGATQKVFSAGVNSSNNARIDLRADGRLQVFSNTSGVQDISIVFDPIVFRDVSAWYHFTVIIDTTSATQTDRVQLYVNGTRHTGISSTGGENIWPDQNDDSQFNTTVEHNIGRQYYSADAYYDGYLAEINFIDGQALGPTSFGEFKSGIWVPVDTADLTFGTNGFRLQFGDTTEASGFNAVTWTGNGTSQSISGTGFSSSPDLVWTKKRSSTSAHYLVDSVRGSDKVLFGNLTDAEATSSNVIASLDSDGFSIGADGGINASGQTFVGWTWDAGSGSAASNTDGSITSTVKANTTYGFSIASYTGNATAGATIGHGLGVAPDMIIVKNRNLVDSWLVKHSSFADDNKALFLNETGQAGSSSTYWNNTAPTASVFSVGTDGKANGSGQNIIAYCFAEKTGFSKIGSYTGTGAAGNSITLGFKPAFLLIKETGNANSWELFDNTRNTSSPFDKRLFPNDSAAEATTTSLSYSDTGFETLNGNTGINVQ
jgi:hypothetical protein